MDTNQPAGSNNGASNHNIMAVFAYLGVLILVPFLTEAKNDPFVKFHIKQGLVLIIIEVVTWVLMSGTPILSWFFIGPFVWLFTVVMMIIGIINAVSGKEQELPLIGQFAKNFKF